MEQNSNLPMVKKNTLPEKLKKSVIKTSKVIGSATTFGASAIALIASVGIAPVLTLPFGAVTIYTAQKFLNNTMYKSFKDLAFIARKHHGNMKIYQDVARPDLFNKLRGLDDRQKLGFLQLQALVGMTKFDLEDKKGNPITIETDSHGIIRKTFQDLARTGYLQNYEEKYLKNSNLILPKLTFGNTKIQKETEIYNMKFQKTNKEIDFEDPEFKKMFPMVFSKRGILKKQDYKILRDEEGRLTIDYGKRKNKQQTARIPEITQKDEPKFREEIKVNKSLEEQQKFAKEFTKKDTQINMQERVEEAEK